MSKEDIIKIFQDYVNNDYIASENVGYVRDALFAVANEDEIKELGFDWVLEEE